MKDEVEKILLRLESQAWAHIDNSDRVETALSKILALQDKAQVEAVRAERGCPCLLVEPCSSNCSCANSVMSGGCMRCCKYGSLEQRKASAVRLANLKEDGETK